MDRIVECVPNFSEGRNQTHVRALLQAVESVTGVRLLDHTMDADHHRCILTFAGSPEAVVDAAFRAIRIATELIDLCRHDGVHPRVGATDVVPFVPIRRTTMEDCVRLAKQLGQRVGEELAIPVFLYERAAAHRDHRPLESIRRGGLQGLAFRMASDADWIPDFGPPHLHRTAGAIVIGARPPLIAFNVNLRSKDLQVARSIAKDIRQSNGGLPCLKAIGVELATRKMVQVAMNLTDYLVTPLQMAFDAVQTRATAQGVAIAESQVIGLVPQAALVQIAVQRLKLTKFDQAQVLESRLEDKMSGEPGKRPVSMKGASTDLQHQSLADFLDAVAAATPTPAGGTVAGLAGALAASLGIMGAKLGRQSHLEHRLQMLDRRLRELMQDDGEAYRQFLQATALPKTDPARPLALSSALHVATEIPLAIGELATETGGLLHSCSTKVKPQVQSDIRVGLLLAIASAEAALLTVECNLKIQPNQQLKVSIQPRVHHLRNCLEELRGLCYTPPPSRPGLRRTPAQAQPEKARRRHAWKSKSSTTTSKKRSKLRRKSLRGKGSSGN